jgi:hypothetical protein
MPILSLYYYAKYDYQFSQTHLKMGRSIISSTFTPLKIVVVVLIVVFSLDIKSVMGLFYLNTLIILIINMFRQSEDQIRRQGQKLRVSSYFVFINLLTALFLLLGSGAFLGLRLWDAGETLPVLEVTGQDKRNFLFAEFRKAIPKVLLLFLLTSLYLYTKSLKRFIKTCEKEFERLDAGLKHKPVFLRKDSFFLEVFVARVSNIMDLDANLINSELKFKNPFLAGMTRESLLLQRYFKPFFDERRKNIHNFQSITKRVMNSVTDVHEC